MILLKLLLRLGLLPSASPLPPRFASPPVGPLRTQSGAPLAQSGDLAVALRGFLKGDFGYCFFDAQQETVKI